MAILITNIGLLVNTREENRLLRGKELAKLPTIKDAYLVVEGDEIVSYGAMKDSKFRIQEFNEHYDATGCMVLPSWCDSHTHLVFSGSRENEFVDKIRGLSYQEIAAKGGGILNSARKLNQAVSVTPTKSRTGCPQAMASTTSVASAHSAIAPSSAPFASSSCRPSSAAFRAPSGVS